MLSGDKILTRQLGREGPELPAIGLSCIGMSPGFYGNCEEARELMCRGEQIPVDNNSQTTKCAKQTLKCALDLGCTFWDTADLYGNGHNERLLSGFLKENRKEIFLATKGGVSMDKNQKFVVKGDYQTIIQSCNESLKRLETSYIDLYLLHRIDTQVAIEESMKAMIELKNEKKIRNIGLCECSAETLRKAAQMTRIAAVQVEYSPWALEIEKNDLIKTCEELDIAVIASCPLGRGFFGGNIRSVRDLPHKDDRHSNPRFSEKAINKNMQLLEALEHLAKEEKCTTAQLCLAWLLNQSNNIFVMPGTNDVQHLKENWKTNQIKLDKDVNKKIRQMINGCTADTGRYAKPGEGLGQICV